MRLDMKLKDIRRAVGNCMRCNMCTYSDLPDCYTICPIYNYDKCFSYSGGGYMYLAKNLVDKNITFDPRVISFLYMCPGCLACDDICEIIPVSEPYIRLFDIIRLMRNEVVKRGLIPEEKLEALRKQVKRYDAGTSSVENNILGIPKNIYNKDADKVLFVESSFLKPQQRTYQSILRLFEKIGEPIDGISDGGLNLPKLYDLGFWEEVKEYLTTKFDIKELNGKEIIFVDSHLQEFFTHRFPEIISGYENIKSWHVSEVLLNALKEDKLRSKKGLEGVKVSYHDPCYLGRGLGIYDAPRELLSLIDGVELIEMERNRRNSFCCGARAGDNYFKDFSKTTALERLNEFKKTGADLLITACPYCKDIFQNMMPDKKQRSIQDLAVFIEGRTE